MMHRLYADNTRMIALLEAEPVWQNRYSLPEPTRTQFLELEENLQESMDALVNNQAALEENDLTSPPSEVSPALEANWDRQIASATAAGESGLEIRDGLRQLINTLRSARHAPPLPEE